VLVHLLLVLEQVLDAVVVGYVAALFHTRAVRHALFPGFKGGEVVDFHAGPARGCDPAVVGEIWDVSVRRGEESLQCYVFGV
jgi:hypothetical protein